ncbi:BCCT family transporter [Streptomyces sp. ISL-87]|uniref:BCCT family transporter n=2 Tax=Streptomyces TaxID=1883 RepID=UPI0035AB9FA6
MGIGLMFYGVGEPLTHYLNPPPASGAAPGLRGRPRHRGRRPRGPGLSFFHWTLTVLWTERE